MKSKYLILLSFICLFNSQTKAQDDSSFAQIYRTLRDMTESLKTYSLYIVPFESTDKLKLGPLHQRKLLEVFHFLKKGKTLSFENPDFIIGFLVDSQRLHTPNGGVASTSSSGGSGGRLKFSQATHEFYYTVLIHTRKNQQLTFKLGGTVYVTKRKTDMPSYSFNNRVVDSFTRYRSPENRGYLLSGGTSSQSSAFLDGDLMPSVDDYKTQLIKVLQLYKNKYIDRVYN